MEQRQSPDFGGVPEILEKRKSLDFLNIRQDWATFVVM